MLYPRHIFKLRNGSAAIKSGVFVPDLLNELSILSQIGAEVFSGEMFSA